MTEAERIERAAMRFWCWLCFHSYMMLPMARSHKSLYGRAMGWVLGWAGAYAHSDRSNFHLCRFFYKSDEEQSAAWDRHSAAEMEG